MKKWCTHCEKDNHSDDECWSTRSIPPRDYGMTPPPLFTLYLEHLRRAPLIADKSNRPDPEPFL